MKVAEHKIEPLKAQEVIKIYNEVLNKVLLLGESALPDTNYKAFRKLVIDEFGHGGAKDKVRALFEENRHDTDQISI